jgi:hypothetical protein
MAVRFPSSPGPLSEIVVEIAQKGEDAVAELEQEHAHDEYRSNASEGIGE